MFEEKPFGASDTQNDIPTDNESQTRQAQDHDAQDHDEQDQDAQNDTSPSKGQGDGDFNKFDPNWEGLDSAEEIGPDHPFFKNQGGAELDSEEPESDEAGLSKDWEAEAQKYQDQYLRSLAELENSKRRFQKEKEDTLRFASESVIRDIVPLLDNLNLALFYADLSNPGVKNLAEGVRMTLKGCLDALAPRGLKELEPQRGDLFDPNIHEAIGQETDAGLPDKTVTRVVSKGYFLHQKLLRPAKVLVNKNKAE
jgi:molecular chaperone GrpE